MLQRLRFAIDHKDFSDKSITLFLQALPSPGPETLPSKVTATPHTIRCNPLIFQIPLLLITKCASTLPPLWHSNQVGFMPLTDLELTLYRFRSHSVDFMSLRSPQRHLLSSASGVKTLRSVPCTVPQPLWVVQPQQLSNLSSILIHSIWLSFKSSLPWYCKSLLIHCATPLSIMKHTSTLLYGFPIELTSCCLRSHFKVHTYLYQLEGESNENPKVLEVFKDHWGPSHLILPSPLKLTCKDEEHRTPTQILYSSITIVSTGYCFSVLSKASHHLWCLWPPTFKSTQWQYSPMTMTIAMLTVNALVYNGMILFIWNAPHWSAFQLKLDTLATDTKALRPLWICAIL